jgi:hypothetical protein
MPRGPYSPEERARGLEIYMAEGLTVAARAIGCSTVTIAEWAGKAGLITQKAEQTRASIEAAHKANEKKREELKVELLNTAALLLARVKEPVIDYVGQQGRQVTRPVPPAKDCRDHVVGAAVCIDKYELLTGGATDRNEVVNITREVEEMAVQFNLDPQQLKAEALRVIQGGA